MPWGHILIEEDPLLTSYYQQSLKSRLGDISDHPAPLRYHTFSMELLQSDLLDAWRKEYFGSLSELLGEDQFNLMMGCLGRYEYLVESHIFPDMPLLIKAEEKGLPLSLIYERFVSLSKTCLSTGLLYLNDLVANKNKPEYAHCLENKKYEAVRKLSWLSSQRGHIKSLHGWIGSFYKDCQVHVSQVYDKTEQSGCWVFLCGYKKGTKAYELGKLYKEHVKRYRRALPEIIKAHKDLSKAIKLLAVHVKDIQPDNDLVTVLGGNMMEMAILPVSGPQGDISGDEPSDTAALLP